jgi:hypothetical protein
MTHLSEVETFRAAWYAEAQDTLRLLAALPADQYDFRPDPKGRSIGEMPDRERLGGIPRDVGP